MQNEEELKSRDKMSEEREVAKEEAILDHSNNHTHQNNPMQAVPAPSETPPTSHTNHTHSLDPPPQNLPMPVYQPPPVMTILSLDDPNLNREDPAIQLSTMPENRFDNVPTGGVHPLVHPQGVAQPVSQPVPQSSSSQFVVVAEPKVNVQHQQLGHPVRGDLQMGQAPFPVNQHTGLHNSQPVPRTYPPNGQPVQFAEPFSHSEIHHMHPHSGQAHPDMGQHPYQPTGQSGLYYTEHPHPHMGQTNLQPSHLQVGQSGHIMGEPAQHTLPQMGQVNPAMGQPALQPHLQVGQSNPTTVQSHDQLHPNMGQPHPEMGQNPQMVQPALQPGQSHPFVGQHQHLHTTVQQTDSSSMLHNQQAVCPDSIPNQRVAYGPIPNPPGYDQALNLPSQAPPPHPLPPPVSLPTPPQTSQSHPHNQFDPSGQFLNQVAVTTADNYHVGQTPQHTGTPPALQSVTHPVGPVQNRFQEPAQPVNPQPSMPSADAAKIRELEHLLQMKEKSERERRENEERERAAILQEKKKWEEERLRESQKIERQKLELEQEQAAIAKSKEDLERMRLQMEEEKKTSLKESEQLRQLLRIQQSAQRDQRAFMVNQGLPGGWEKRLDHTTGRFYYIDHNTKTTHWNPPANWLDYQAQLQRRAVSEGPGGQILPQTPHVHRGPPQVSPQVPPPQQMNTAAGRVGYHDNVHAKGASIPHQVPAPALPQQQPIRSSTTPAPLEPSHPRMGQTVAKAVAPSVDRSNKPQAPPTTQASTPSVDRSTKPTMSPAVFKKKVAALQPMYGSSQVGLYYGTVVPLLKDPSHKRPPPVTDHYYLARMHLPYTL